MYQFGYYSIIPSGSNKLMHYGISGQRWGIRRFQNEDRTFTEAGKRRYYPERNPLLIRKVKPVTDEEKQLLEKRIKDAEKEAIRSAKIYNKNMYVTGPGLIREKSFLAYYNSEKKVKDLKILQKLQNKKFISQHQLNIAQKYKDQGMSDEEARVQAYKRIQTEKILATAAVTTVAMAVAHVDKMNRVNMDAMIPKGTTIQNLSADPNKGVNDAFYASFEKGDNEKYRRLFGGDHLQRQGAIQKFFGLPGGDVDVAELTAAAKTNLKIAGADVARDTVGNLIKSNPSYANALRNMINDPEFQMAEVMQRHKSVGLDNLRSALQGGKLNKDGYNLVNRLLVVHDRNGQIAGNTLYEALRSKGYDGTIDINDMLNSGYNAKRPIIMFNGGAKLGNISRRMIDPKTLKLGAMLENGKIFLRQALDFYGPISVAAVAVTNLAKSNKVQASIYERRIIMEYKKEHPNTQLTNKQILKNQIGG